MLRKIASHEPATFAQYATSSQGRGGLLSPYDPADAIYTAAAMLCANGAASGTTTVTSAVKGLFRTNEATRAEAMSFVRDGRGH